MFVIGIVVDSFIRHATFDNRPTLSTELPTPNISNNFGRIDLIGSIDSVVAEAIRPDQHDDREQGNFEKLTEKDRVRWL